ncbi:gustatory receptor for sugar taste 64a-like isoform X3 [Toxorhynchites rutilus septentrionalis]|uniref:gustatory receptor for sugar taste 64a-like isoform X3 n=1 Tax=Toxorhynchites rutilus septentrionalis TaxID=329112 RepID=UPI002479F5E9|nr:gustatory receptor for sugar taste 64a-like isoform X3 [Toxorhynchites rutilus septentrionalis]
MHLDSFNNAMCPIFAFFQLIGTFPVTGIRQKEHIDLRFKWFSMRTMFSFVLIVIGLVMSYIEYERLYRVGVNARNIVGIVFYINTVLILILLVNLARHWRSLAIKWEYVDRLFQNRDKIGRSLNFKIRVASCVLILCGILEHLLSKAADVYNQYHEAKFCHWDVDNFPRYFASRHYSFIFKHIPFNILILLFTEYANFALTMAWTCQDLMIILFSIGLSFHFEQIFVKVRCFSTGITIADEKFWVDIRSQYVLLCDLVNETNELLAPLIISSCGTNLYLICFQLLNITRKEESFASLIDHCYALAYLICKTALVFYSAAMINETAKAPLAICTKIPNIGWCLELDRFTSQLRTQRVAFSGRENIPK